MSVNYQTAFLTIATADSEHLVAFYSQLLGQQPSSYIPQVYAEFKLAELRLAIFQPQPDCFSEFANSNNSGMSICLEVENLEKAIAYLTQMGYPPPGQIKYASHGQEIYAYDPEGNRLILHQSNPKR